MKWTLPILLMCAGMSYGQECPEGLVWFEAIATTSLIINGECVTPERKAELWRIFWKNLCGETSFSWWSGGDGGLSYSRNNDWDDSLGCISTETYRQKRNGVWVIITKEEYDERRQQEAKQ